jgi:predicted RNA binding protein YcfA (HicA-like mRNA interferase family)
VTVSQSGSHVKLEHPVKESVLIVPNHGAKEVKTGLCKAILKQAGIKK